LTPEKDQTAMLEAVIRGTSAHTACVVAYSNNL
jgi:hypothetical protein